jgi:hypothetical protein
MNWTLIGSILFCAAVWGGTIIWATPYCAPGDHSGARIGGVIMIEGCR